MDKPALCIALVGRPNVGKSTLFNRLAQKRLALVHDMPGVTRDFKIARGHLFDMPLSLIDTAGFEDTPAGTLGDRLLTQTYKALAMADVVLFLISAKDGLTPHDEAFARLLRAAVSQKPIVVCVNKAENPDDASVVHAAYGLGFETVVPIASAHGLGLDDLYHALLPFAALASPAHNTEKPLFQLAFIGRPNVGKSTIINGLVGDTRMLTGAEAGLTRDSVTIPLPYKQHLIHLMDTAGLKRRGHMEKGALDQLVIRDTERAITFAQVVGLVVDASLGMDTHDLKLARHVIDEGRALLIVLNKWDMVTDKPKTLESVQETLQYSFHQVKKVPLVPVSALHHADGLNSILHHALSLYDQWCTRIPTARLNTFLAEALQYNPPPMVSGFRLKIKYMTQIKARPPTFMLFGSKVDSIPDSYVRYLQNRLCETFALDSVPVRFLFKKTLNPYD